MMRSRSRLLFLAVLVLAACAREQKGASDTSSTVSTPKSTIIEVGRPAPAYDAVTLDGDKVSLGGLRGKVVLLNVWATWCMPCRDEIPYLESLYQRHNPKGLEIVGVSVDARGSETAIQDFRRDFKMTYPIWLDPDERVQALYRALGVPASYLIDRDGILRWRHLGAIRSDDPMLTQALVLALNTSASR
ncbi:MAG: TlpA disulfide reductase family protein [Gemmatimonadaceae bacterium]